MPQGREKESDLHPEISKIPLELLIPQTKKLKKKKTVLGEHRIHCAVNIRDFLRRCQSTNTVVPQPSIFYPLEAFRQRWHPVTSYFFVPATLVMHMTLSALLMGNTSGGVEKTNSIIPSADLYKKENPGSVRRAMVGWFMLYLQQMDNEG